MNLNILLQILGVLLLEAIGITASMISCHVGNRMYEKEKEEQRKALLGNDGDEQAPLSEENPVAQPVINDLQNTDKTEISKARNKVNLIFALQLVGIWLGIFLAYSFISLMIAVVTGYKPGQLFTFGIVCLQIYLTKVAVSRSIILTYTILYYPILSYTILCRRTRHEPVTNPSRTRDEPVTNP